MRKDIKAYVEAELRYYHRSKQDLEDLTEKIVDAGGESNDINRTIRGSGTSDSTGNKAMKLITNKRIRILEDTINAIEVVLGELDEHKYKLVELKYFKRPKTLTDEGIAQELNIDRATLYRWQKGILMAIAEEMGLIDLNLQQTCNN